MIEVCFWRTSLLRLFSPNKNTTIKSKLGKRTRKSTKFMKRFIIIFFQNPFEHYLIKIDEE